MATQNRFSPAVRAQLEAMLAEPEVVEVHGNDTAWKNGVIGAVMATAALSFASVAHADSPSLFERTISNVVSNVATNAVATGVRNVMNEGFSAVTQGTRDLVKGESSAEKGQVAQGINPGNRTIFNASGVNVRTTTQAKPSLAQSLGIARTEVPQSTTELAEIMVRNDVGSIAATSKLRPVLFPVVIGSGDAYSQYDDAAKRATAVVQQAGQGGAGLLRDSLMQAKVNGPTAMMYMGLQPNTSGCLIVVHSSQSEFAQRMSLKTGLSPRESMDFAVLHEAAHCAQQGEAIAAALDAQGGRSAQARQRIAVSGLVDVHTENAIKTGTFARMSSAEEPDKSMRSSERYADAFAALAMNAQQPLNGQQWNGIASWRINAGGHDTSNFIKWVQDQVQRDPRAQRAMQSSEGAGYNAQAVASFLKPIWKAFESRELELEQNRERANQSSRPSERVGQTSAERVSLAAQFGIRPAGETSATPQRSDPRGYTDEDLESLRGGAPRPR